MPDKDIFTLTISELSHYISTRQISPVEVLNEYTERIEKTDPQLNSFITKMFEHAARKAEDAERQILKGEYKGPLHGIPIGLRIYFGQKVQPLLLDPISTRNLFLQKTPQWLTF